MGKTKRFKYECDGGTIMLGNEGCRVCIPNNYGDGEFTVEISDDRDAKLVDRMDWKGTVEGDNIHIYSYDCLHGDDEEDKDYILYTLPAGRYAIYVSRGYVVLERWN